MSTDIKSLSNPDGEQKLSNRTVSPSFSDGAGSRDESLLIREARSGSWEAFAELTTYYDRSVLALTLQLTDSELDARELFRKAFVNAYRELPTYRFQSTFYLWIYQIVARTCIQFLEQRQGTVQRATSLESILQQLSPRERMVFELKQYFGLKLETIAAILGISQSAARNILVRAVLLTRLERASSKEHSALSSRHSAPSQFRST
jgi:RNA polymerase sigma-70 factor, ECF subfamily